MKNKLIALIIVLICGVQICAGDWLEIGPDARALGMGGAQLAVNDGVYSSYWNPAAITVAREFGSTFATLLGEVNYNYIGYMQPIGPNAAALNYISMGVDGFKKTNYTNNRPYDEGQDFSNKNGVLMISYATPWIQKLDVGTLQIGTTLKLVNESIGEDSASGIGLDFGLLYYLNKQIQIGGVLNNVIPPTVKWETGTNETFPLKLRAGGAYHVEDNLLIAADIDLYGFEAGGLYLGVEYWPIKMLAIRGGYNKNAISMGLGLLYEGLKFDFSFTQAPADYMDATTRFSLGYVFKKLKGKKKTAEGKLELPEEISPKTKFESARKIVEKSISPTRIVEEREIKGLKPRIEMKIKRNIIEVNRTKIALSGRVSNAKTLLINGKKLYFRGDGKFYVKKRLKKGMNIFVLKAFSASGQMTKIVRKVKRL